MFQNLIDDNYIKIIIIHGNFIFFTINLKNCNIFLLTLRYFMRIDFNTI